MRNYLIFTTSTPDNRALPQGVWIERAQVKSSGPETAIRKARRELGLPEAIGIAAVPSRNWTAVQAELEHREPILRLRELDFHGELIAVDEPLPGQTTLDEDPAATEAEVLREADAELAAAGKDTP